MAKPLTAEYFTTDGRITKVSPANGKTFTWKELQKLVGGTIEMVTFPGGKECMIVNEEGRLLQLPYNELATGQWLIEFPLDKYPHNNLGSIVGDALITPLELIR